VTGGIATGTGAERRPGGDGDTGRQGNGTPGAQTPPNLRRPTPNLVRAGRPPRRFTRFVAGSHGPSLRVTPRSPMLSILYHLLRDYGRSMSCAELCQRYHEYVTGQPLLVTDIPLSMENKVYVLLTRGDPQWHVDALIRLEEEGDE
jgi:hypothetical protein